MERSAPFVRLLRSSRVRVTEAGSTCLEYSTLLVNREPASLQYWRNDGAISPIRLKKADVDDPSRSCCSAQPVKET